MSKQLIRKHLGEMPLLQTMIQNLRFREVLHSYVKAHGNETIPAVDTLLLMVCNITCGRQPLYELPEWIDRLEPRSLGKVDTGGYQFNGSIRISERYFADLGHSFDLVNECS